MMATALGARFNAVRDVRRTFRAGLWLIAIMLPPYWLLLWHVGDLMRAFGQSAELASQGQTFLRAYMWCTAPWLLFQLLRNFVSALERPRIMLWLSLGGIALNALLSWSLIFGHFGLPALGLVGGGVGSTLTWLIMCGALIAVVVATGGSGASTCSAAGGGSTGSGRGDDPAGLADRADDGARNGRVRARRLFHGLDRRARRSPPTPSRCRSRH